MGWPAAAAGVEQQDGGWRQGACEGGRQCRATSGAVRVRRLKLSVTSHSVSHRNHGCEVCFYARSS